MPELKDIEPAHLHQWYDYYDDYDVDYPKPIVDYKKQKIQAMKLYKAIYK